MVNGAYVLKSGNVDDGCGGVSALGRAWIPILEKKSSAPLSGNGGVSCAPYSIHAGAVSSPLRESSGSLADVGCPLFLCLLCGLYRQRGIAVFHLHGSLPLRPFIVLRLNEVGDRDLPLGCSRLSHCDVFLYLVCAPRNADPSRYRLCADEIGQHHGVVPSRLTLPEHECAEPVAS